MRSQNQTMKTKIVKASTTKFLKVKPSCRKNIVILLSSKKDGDRGK